MALSSGYVPTSLRASIVFSQLSDDQQLSETLKVTLRQITTTAWRFTKRRLQKEREAQFFVKIIFYS